MKASDGGDEPHKIPDWLEDLAGRSYEPELIVSGAGIYLTGQLPGAVDYLYFLFETNFLPGTTSSQDTLGLLIFGLLKTLSIILVATFVFHFAARAFWVGMLGLHSIYPQGILFYKLFRKSRQPARLLALMRLKVGSMQSFLIRLDRFCSGIFALAFLIGFTGIGLSAMYAFGLGFMQLAALLVPVPQLLELLPQLALALFILPLMIGYGMYYIPRKWAKRVAIDLIMWYNAMLAVPFPIYAIQRLSLTFQSHVSRYKFIFYNIVIGLGIVMLWIWFAATGVDGSRQIRISLRDFFNERNNSSFTVHAEWYDDSRPKGSYIRDLSLPSEFADRPILKIFLAYPKSLDRKIGAVCGDAAATSENRDSVNQYCLNRLYRIALNDSVLNDLEFLSYQHPNQGEKGFLLYIPIGHLPTGKKHMLKIGYRSVPDSSQVMTDSVKYRVPFWYVPER